MKFVNDDDEMVIMDVANSSPQASSWPEMWSEGRQPVGAGALSLGELG